MSGFAGDGGERPEVRDDPPPFLGSWRRVYAAVLGYLVLVIFVFYLFEAAATP